MNRIFLALDRSTEGHIHLSRDGRPVDIEEAFRDGFVVESGDSNAVLQLVRQHLTNLAHFQK